MDIVAILSALPDLGAFRFDFSRQLGDALSASGRPLPEIKARLQPDQSSCYTCIRMLAIRLPPAIEQRLERLARRTGRTKTFYAREAILEHLDNLEDIYLAEEIWERIRRGEERTIPLNDALKRHAVRR